MGLINLWMGDEGRWEGYLGRIDVSIKFLPNSVLFYDVNRWKRYSIVYSKVGNVYEADDGESDNK